MARIRDVVERIRIEHDEGPRSCRRPRCRRRAAAGARRASGRGGITCAGVNPAATMSAISRCAPHGTLPSVPSAISHAPRAQAREIARLDPHGRPAARAGRSAAACSSCHCASGMLPRSQLRSVRDPAVGEVRHDHEARTLARTTRRLVVHVGVANAVRERVEVGDAASAFASAKFEEVRRHANPALLCASSITARVELGRELLVHTVAVVDPDLDDVDRERGLLAHGRCAPRPPSSPNTECRYGPVPAQ